MRAKRLLLPLTLLVAAPLLLAACGGDDGGSEDEDQITEAIETAVTTTDPDDCTRLQTEDFLDQSSFSGTSEEALAECEEDVTDTSDDPDSVDVANIEVDGDAATADVAFTGGTIDGTTLSLSLVKEDDQWKLDGIEDIPEFNREAFEQSFADQIAAAPNIPAQIADCIVQEFGAAGDDELKSAFLSGDGDELNALFEDCIPS